MPAGYAHIIRLGEIAGDSSGLHVTQYQFTFNDGQRNYAKTFDEVGLIDFMADELGMDPAFVDATLTELRDKGTVTINDMRISDNDASFMGLNVVQSEF